MVLTLAIERNQQKCGENGGWMVERGWRMKTGFIAVMAVYDFFSPVFGNYNGDLVKVGNVKHKI